MTTLLFAPVSFLLSPSKMAPVVSDTVFSDPISVICLTFVPVLLKPSSMLYSLGVSLVPVNVFATPIS